MALQLAECGMTIFLCREAEEGMELKQIKHSAYLCGQIVQSNTAIAWDFLFKKKKGN